MRPQVSAIRRRQDAEFRDRRRLRRNPQLLPRQPNRVAGQHFGRRGSQFPERRCLGRNSCIGAFKANVHCRRRSRGEPHLQAGGNQPGILHRQHDAEGVAKIARRKGKRLYFARAEDAAGSWRE